MTASWKSKLCSGMDIVERINFVRMDTTPDGTVVTANAVYCVGADSEKPRSEWSDAEIDAIGDTLAPSLDARIALMIAQMTPAG